MTRVDKAITDELAMHERLSKWFLGRISDTQAKDIVVHLGDLYGAAGRIRSLLEELVGTETSNADLARKRLVAIETELYDHVNQHLEELRIPLHDLIDDLYSRTDK